MSLAAVDWPDLHQSVSETWGLYSLTDEAHQYEHVILAIFPLGIIAGPKSTFH